MPHVEQELLTLPGQLSAPQFLLGSSCSIFNFLCNVLYIIGCFWILCCLSFDLRPLITLLDIVLSVLRFTASDYRPLIIGLWLSASDLRPLITGLWLTVSDYRPLIYGLWLPSWYLQTFLITSLFCSWRDIIEMSQTEVCNLTLSPNTINSNKLL